MSRRKTRVLVVDDSAFSRKAVTEALSRDPDVDVIGTAPDGSKALQMLETLQPDVLTLDVDMPHMDGLATLRELRRTHPHLPVIMCSALTERGAVATLDALAAGATCYVAKPTQTAGLEDSLRRLQGDLLPKIKALGPMAVAERRKIRAKALLAAPSDIPTEAPPLPTHPHPSSPLPRPSASGTLNRVELVVIATSTGGPAALASLLPALPSDFPVPVAVVQHMPPVFTRQVAQRLNALCPLVVQEARHGEPLLPGAIYLAPGDYHLVLKRSASGSLCRVELNQNSPEHFCRPSANVLFRSAAAAFGPNTLAIVLTGMGTDGAEGCRTIRQHGGQVFAQDEASSVIWGMPRSVVEQGLADAVLPLEQIAPALLARVAATRSPS